MVQPSQQFGCPLLATDIVYNVRQSKTVPDASRPRWVHLFRRFIYLPFNRVCWLLMGIEPAEPVIQADGTTTDRFTEGQQSFTHLEDARALLKIKGPTWYIEPSPLNGCLPDKTCAFDTQEFPKGETLYRNGTAVFPTALPSDIATLQRGVQLLNQKLNRTPA